ncbi:MAG: McrB family protein [Eubacteriales bacterium]
MVIPALSLDNSDFLQSIRNSGIWSALTGHTAVFLYMIALLLLLILFVVLLTLRFHQVQTVGAKSGGSAKGAEEEPRFYRLCQTDRQTVQTPKADPDLTLSELCTRFRNFAAGQMGLYYDADVIRSFVAGMSVTKLIIMQGISGTGKTSLAYAFGKFMGNDAVMVPVQPSWKDRTDLLGYFNEFTGTFHETELLQKLYEAGTNDRVYVAVLDEMNIARVEYYFAEFLSVLELPDSQSRTVEIVSDSRSDDPKRLKNGKLHIPDTVWFVGTANNDDSTLAISDKVYDRAMVLDLDRRAKPFSASGSAEGVSLTGNQLDRLFREARVKYRLSEEVREKIEALDAYLIGHLGITFGNRIMSQIEGFIPVYLACGGREMDGVDQIIARKVLRKLENQNPVYVRTEAKGLEDCLDNLFGEDGLPLCRRTLGKFLH